MSSRAGNKQSESLVDVQTGKTNGVGRDGELAREDIFDVLSNERRRYALQYLEQHSEDDVVEFSDLVEYIAACENDTTLAKVDYKQRKRVYSSLRQTHLPKMVDCNLIEYDRDRGTISLDTAHQEAKMYLEYVPERDIPWCYYYLGLAAILGGIVVLTWANVNPFGGLSGLALAGMSVVLLAVSAVVHTVYTKRHALGSPEEAVVES